MIVSYRDKRTRKFAKGETVREFQSFARQAEKRLEILDAAPTKEALMMLHCVAVRQVARHGRGVMAESPKVI
jgi:plasmid maintenance system killer protein